MARFSTNNSIHRASRRYRYFRRDGRSLLRRIILMLFVMETATVHYHAPNYMILLIVASTTTSNPASTFMRYKYGSDGRSSCSSTTTTTATITPTTAAASTIWVYTGSLMDPYTGQRICNVQGIEYIQPICQISVGDGDDVGRINTRTTRTSVRNHNRERPDPHHHDHHNASPVLPPWFQQYRRRCRSLQIASILEEYIQNDSSTSTTKDDSSSSPPLLSPLVLQSNTMVSRKLFCYTQPTTSSATSATIRNAARRNHGKNNNKDDDTDSSANRELPPSIPNLFTSYRKTETNPLGPTTHIPLDQAMTCYDSIISTIGVTTTRTTNNNNNNNNDITDQNRDSDHPPVSSSTPSSSWILHTEIPNTSTHPTRSNRLRSSSKCIWSCIDGTTISSSGPLPPEINDAKQDDTVFDFSIFTRRRSVPLSLSTVLPSITGTNQHNSSSPTCNNSRRRPWLQFGSGGSRKNELGVRETYQFYHTATTTTKSTTPNEMKVRYTRYGEAPVWYGPGRVCLLELVGTRINRSTHDTDGTDSVARVSDTVHQRVPVISSIISNYIPDFWNLLPRVADETLSNHRMYSDKHDEHNFLYSADALQPALQSQQQQQQQDTNDNTSMNNRRSMLTVASATITRADDYRQYYHDLAIGRKVQALLTPSTVAPSPPQQLLHSIEDERRRRTSPSTQRRRQIISDVQGIVFSTWDKLRTASSLSLW